MFIQMRGRASVLGAFACLLVLSGCSYTTTYQKDMVQTRSVSAEERIAGKALVYTEVADDDYIFSGNPTSFTGSATTLSVPLGLMTREIARTVFGEVCVDGADHANSLANAAQYRVVIRPRVTAFEYGYPQLKNLGFAITPEAKVDLNVKVLDAAGKPTFDRDYPSGVIEGKSYMLSGKPEQRVARIAHQAIYDQLRKAAIDIRDALAAAPAP